MPIFSLHKEILTSLLVTIEYCKPCVQSMYPRMCFQLMVSKLCWYKRLNVIEDEKNFEDFQSCH